MNNIGQRVLGATVRQALRNVRFIPATIAKALCFGLLATGFAPNHLFASQFSNPIHSLPSQKNASAPSTIETRPAAAHRPKRADFKQESASYEARHLADWVVDSGNNRMMPFVIVDKKEAKVFVFHPDGRIRGAAPALLGLAIGDYAVPGIGDRKMSSIRPEERTTPAGRFVASLGRNLSGVEILWIDYDAAISMHRVVTSKPKERRLQRLLTPTTHDKRISYGCINVPVKFYVNVLSPSFTGTDGIVYVLPETRSARELFGSYDVEE
jgi:hypothetical protein